VIIAIDGLTAAGKGTLARRLAAELGFAHLDTGLLYRAVAARLLDAGIDPADAEAAAAAANSLVDADLRRDDLRAGRISQPSSIVAAHPAVRAALIAFQRGFARRPPPPARGAVLDGRDIGTVICPDAEVKLFVTARPEVRAQRRFRELQARGETTTYAAVFRDLQARDARDTGRGIAPTKAARDAVELDTSELDADQALARALQIVRSRRPDRG
jgi:cytidylate kinase